MKTSVMEVHDMLSVYSVLGVEQKIGEVPGVESVTVNYAAGSATVRYDETRLDIADIRMGVRQLGFESAAAGSPGTAHQDHTGPGASPDMPASPASPTPPPTAPPTAPIAAPAVPASASAADPEEQNHASSDPKKAGESA